MTENEYLLTKLAEECCEVAQRASKALCFGILEVQPGQPLTNAERIMDEMEDLRVIEKMLIARGVLKERPLCAERFAAKFEKVRRFMGYSVECGTLQQKARSQ